MLVYIPQDIASTRPLKVLNKLIELDLFIKLNCRFHSTPSQ
jgi:hypothetical protein